MQCNNIKTFQKTFNVKNLIKNNSQNTKLGLQYYNESGIAKKSCALKAQQRKLVQKKH